MPLGETITVFNKSGKVVSTGKHLLGVFKEAQAAYREKKAEVRSHREAQHAERVSQAHATPPRAIEHYEHHYHIRDADNRSYISSGTRRTHRTSRRPPPSDRTRSVRHGHTSRSRHDADPMPHPTRSRTFPMDLPVAGEDPFPRNPIDGTPVSLVHRPRPASARSASTNDSVDLDLAYGSFNHHSLLATGPTPSRAATEAEVKLKLSALTRMLDEANVLQHTATATIASLQRNPDALAAVALTLAEVSKIASRLGPPALASLKGSFPAAMALLASPQFAIAVGLGVGVTVVMLGGYKIVKRISSKNAEEEGTLVDGALRSRAEEENELLELNKDFGRIENWRRGIPMSAGDGTDYVGSTAGTSVEGEFVTPGASKVLLREGVIVEEDLRSMKTSKTRRSTRTAKTTKTTQTSKSRGDRTVKENKKRDEKEGKKAEKEREKRKGSSTTSGWKRELSGLRSRLLN